VSNLDLTAKSQISPSIPGGVRRQPNQDLALLKMIYDNIYRRFTSSSLSKKVKFHFFRERLGLDFLKGFTDQGSTGGTFDQMRPFENILTDRAQEQSAFLPGFM
jgi:hypothetical protein